MSQAIPDRQSAVPITAAELDDVTKVEKINPENEKSPKVAHLHNGETVGRVIMGGTALSVENQGNNQDYFQMRLVDAAGDDAYVYAGQYQPQALDEIKALETPAHVVVIGKPRTFEPEDSDRVYSSVRPEFVLEVPKGDERAAHLMLDAAEGALDRAEESGDEDIQASAEDLIAEIAGLDTEDGEAEAESDDEEEAEEMTPEELLEEYGRGELRSMASGVEGVNGNAPNPALAGGLLDATNGRDPGVALG